ncbi:MAG TPA: hypothetical protein VMW16_15560 [Sedimentisphaerales bacterium]|nr:hypothetical protein [Sedimentisphaerales bacterium]
MNPKRFLTICISIVLCGVALCNGQVRHNSDLSKPFVSDGQRVPPVIRNGLAWPSSEEIVSKRYPCDPNVENKVRTIISKCITPSLYDPNDPNNGLPEVIRLVDWPDPNKSSTISFFERKGYIFHVRDTATYTYITFKREDGNDIWDMAKDHTKFLSETVDRFFRRENVGPRIDTKTQYAPNEEGTEDFNYFYFPADKKDFSAASTWTNGKIIALCLDKSFAWVYRTKIRGEPEPRDRK